MDETAFEKLGLTKGEIKVYLALNKVGEATVGPIGKESSVSKSKIYDILDKLIDKGLVGFIHKEGTKYFVANDPHMIVEYVERKEAELAKTKKQVQDILPQLLLQRSSVDNKPIAEIYQGYQAMKAVRDELMLTYNPGETFLTVGCPKSANDLLEGYFLEFHRQRLKRYVGMRIIYNADARKYGELRTKMKNTSVRYLPKQFPSPHWIDIFPEVVMFVLISKIPLTIVVRDKSMAESFRGYFELMWKNAKE